MSSTALVTGGSGGYLDSITTSRGRWVPSSRTSTVPRSVRRPGVRFCTAWTPGRKERGTAECLSGDPIQERRWEDGGAWFGGSLFVSFCFFSLWFFVFFSLFSFFVF